MSDTPSRPTTDSAGGHGHVLGSVDIEAPNGRTVEARLRVVEGKSVSKAHLIGMNDLLQLTFGKWPAFDVGGSSVDHLRWKIEGPPGRANSGNWWEVEGDIIGVGLDVYRELRLRSGTRSGRVAADAAVAPAWQGRGLNRHKIRFAAPLRAERAEITIGVTSHRRGVQHRADNWELRAPIRALVSVIAPWRLALVWRESGGRRLPRAAVATGLWGMAAVAKLRGLPARRRLRRPRGAGRVRVRATDRFDPRVDELFEAAARDFDLIGVRRHGYLNWRFCDERGGRYAVLLAEAEESDHLLGYVVTRRDGDRGYVVDLLARPGRLDVVDTLTHRARLNLRGSGAAGVVCWMVDGHPYMPALRRHGFFDSRRRPPFAVRPTGMPPEELTFIREPGARVHLTHGDTDVI